MKPSPRKRSPKPAKGRWARVWLSPEFLAFARLHEQEPARLASCCAHALGLKNPGTLVIVAHATQSKYQKMRDT